LPFQIQISAHERAYLDSLPLSSEAKERINRFIEFIAKESRRLEPGRKDRGGRPSLDFEYFEYCVCFDTVL